jgi:2-hydroxychromene-2-carboxylate isomerase
LSVASFSTSEATPLPRERPLLYIDLGSPYAYLACERAPAVLGMEPELRPVLLGAIFARRGYGSWSATPAREPRIAEVQERARRYGLPPVVWPAGWPGDGLAAMRCATWAAMEGSAAAFSLAVFRAQFGDGADIADPAVLAQAAAAADLDPEAMAAAVQSPEIKLALRTATDAAWDAGVRGIPSLAVGRSVLYGDDQLELGAAALATG